MPATTTTIPQLAREDPVETARAAIWRLFEEGRIDDDMATMSLLAIDIGTRRAHRASEHPARPHGTRHRRRAA
jgi:hypothetical protein